MSTSPYLSSAYMVVDSYFIDDGVIIDLDSADNVESSYGFDNYLDSISDYIIGHTSAFDLAHKDVI